MSHYAVAVFSDDANFDRLLEPYNENNKKYFEFVEKPYETIVESFGRFKESNNGWTLEMYMDEFGYIQKDGKYGYMCNPKGFWDWYSLDGKEYLFDIKNNIIDDPESDDWVGYYRKNDYDWYPKDTEAEKDAAEFWDTFVAPEETPENYSGYFKIEYYRKRYQTKEQYIKEMSRTVPWAFITPDGVWHCSGTMGWFACSDETAEDWNKYVEEWDAYIRSDDNPYVSIVDCHV